MVVVNTTTLANPPTNCRVVDNDGMMSPIWAAWFDSAWLQLIGTITDIASAINDINTVSKTNAISASSTIPTALLTQVDTGTAARVTMAAHTRLYDGGATVDVNSAFVDVPYGTSVGIYYDDLALAGGAVTIHYTTFIAEAQANYVTGRHNIGIITTLAHGAPPVTVPAGGVTPPGSGGGFGGYTLAALP